MTERTAPSLPDARRRAELRWKELREAVSAETGLRWRRRGWSVLTLAFCAGLALAGARRERALKPPEAA